MHSYGGMLRAWALPGLPLQPRAVWGFVRLGQWRTDGRGWWRRDVRSRMVLWNNRVRRRRRRRRRAQLGRCQARGLALRDPVSPARPCGGQRLFLPREECGWLRCAFQRAPRALVAMRGEGAMGAPGPVPLLPTILLAIKVKHCEEYTGRVQGVAARVSKFKSALRWLNVRYMKRSCLMVHTFQETEESNGRVAHK